MDLTRFLLAWRTIPVPDREVIDALVDPAHAAPSAELARALTQWPGSWYWSDEDGYRHLVLTRPDLVERIHAAGLAIVAWTVNAPEDVARLARIGVDGLCGNYPERLLATSYESRH